ncbi:META domain-containing protein [Agromyces marinus]|uniref:META domain-containing protein n=1 Tax=Agromyces marinus TaxID=1389020 RepID=A0ABN6YBW2_9MICO|nr:META domain-containing protein [Agromyces marinus]UIP57337.1 hypothetical protein DSM26151_01920 [Agromyces marinus]BDZ54561.1 META domain-containing protein [Agromyces marinus]
MSSRQGLSAGLAVGLIAAALALSGCSGMSGEDTGGDVDPTGTWGDAEAEGSPYLELADGGGLTGTDGCNRLTGTWSINEADQVEFEDVASTKMACADVDDWLSGLHTAEVANDTMTVLGEDGSPIGTLDRTE